MNNMVPPWGKCGTRELEYYTDYSWFRCKKNCETETVIRKCQCRDIYMVDEKGTIIVCINTVYWICNVTLELFYKYCTLDL